MEKFNIIGSIKFLISCPAATVTPTTKGDTLEPPGEFAIGKSAAVLYTVKKMPTSVKLDDIELNNERGSSTEAVSLGEVDIVGTFELLAGFW